MLNEVSNLTDYIPNLTTGFPSPPPCASWFGGRTSYHSAITAQAVERE